MNAPAQDAYLQWAVETMRRSFDALRARKATMAIKLMREVDHTRLPEDVRLVLALLAWYGGQTDLFAEVGSTLPPAKLLGTVSAVMQRTLEVAQAADGAPYVPTEAVMMRAMLDLARVQPDDFLIDLGSGDGRIVLAAAADYGASGVGFDTDPDLVAQANAEASRLGLADRATFHVQDIFTADLSRATVVTTYLMAPMMERLRPQLASLRPGARIVSHDFAFRDWTPDEQATVKLPADCIVLGKSEAKVYRWNVKATA